MNILYWHSQHSQQVVSILVPLWSNVVPSVVVDSVKPKMSSFCDSIQLSKWTSLFQACKMWKKILMGSRHCGFKHTNLYEGFWYLQFHFEVRKYIRATSTMYICINETNCQISNIDIQLHLGQMAVTVFMSIRDHLTLAVAYHRHAITNDVGYSTVSPEREREEMLVPVCAIW